MPKAHTAPHTLTEGIRIAGMLSALVVVGLLATGCSNKNNTSASSANPILVRIWRTGQPEDVIQSQVDTFVDKNKDKNVKVTYQQRNLDTYELDSLKSLSSRLGPDIWSIPNDWIGDHTTRLTTLPDNYFYPKDSNGAKASSGPSPVDSVKSLYPSGIAEQLISSDGKSVYALPTNVDSLRLYVNQDLLNIASQEFVNSLGDTVSSEVSTPVQQLLSKPAATWLDLTEQVKYITKRSGTAIQRSAIALGTSNNINDSDSILEALMMQNGAQIISTDRRNVLFHIPTTTASGSSVNTGLLALDFFTSFSNPAKATYTWNPSMPQALDAFGQGKVAMVVGFSDLDSQLKIKYPQLSYTVAPLPQKSATETPVNFIRFSAEGVTQTANNSAAAFAFLSTYTDSNSTEGMASQAQLLPPYLSLLTSRKDDPFVKQVLTGKSVYKRSHLQFDATVRQMITDVSQNNLPSDQALNKGAEAITKLLQDDSAL